MEDGTLCNSSPNEQPKTNKTANPPSPKKKSGRPPTRNGQPEFTINTPPQPSPQDQERVRQEEQAEQERLENIRIAEEERQAALRQSNVDNLVEGFSGANQSLVNAGEQLRSELKPGGALTPGQVIRFDSNPTTQGGAAATVTEAVNMDELEEGSSYKPVFKTGLALAKGVVKDPLNPMLDPVYTGATILQIAAESNKYTKFVSRVPTESLVNGYKYSTRAWEAGHAMLKGDGGEAITKILTNEKVFANRAIGEYVANNANVINRNYDKAIKMVTNPLDKFYDEDDPYAYLKSEEAFDKHHKTYGAMMLNTVTPVRAGFIMYEEGRQLPQRAANTPVGQQTVRIVRNVRVKKKQLKKYYTFERTSDDATD